MLLSVLAQLDRDEERNRGQQHAAREVDRAVVGESLTHEPETGEEDSEADEEEDPTYCGWNLRRVRADG